MGIKNWSKDDRPREKLLEKGRREVSEAELLAILIGTGTEAESALDLCRRLLIDCGNDLNQLAKLSVGDLCAYKGMGMVKALRIVAAMELGRRRKKAPTEERPVLDSSGKVYDYLTHLYQDLSHEEVWVIYLDAACRVIRCVLIGSGGMDFTPVDIKTVLRYGIEYKARSLILSHNHPSGTLKASKADIYLTDRILAAGRLFDMDVHDHIIFSDRGYFSFRDEGLMD